jgi:hypothetical protein
MAIITTGQAFTVTGQVTNTKLQDIASKATFNDPVDGTSLELITLGSTNAGKLGIKDDGVTTDKVLDANITVAKIGGITDSLKVIGRTTAGAGAAEEVTINDDDNLSSASAITLATDESIKAYVDTTTATTSNFTTEDGQSAGYQVFPSGLKMAWGSAITSIYPTQGGTVTFPTNATGGTLFDEIPTVQLTYNDEAVNQYATKCKFVTRTNFKNYSQSTTDPGRYLAIGI